MSATRPNPSDIVKASNTQASRATESLKDVAEKKPQVSKGLEAMRQPNNVVGNQASQSKPEPTRGR